MMKLDDYKPTPAEEAMTEHLPEQVAIGFIRARRRDQQAQNLRKMQENSRRGHV